MRRFLSGSPRFKNYYQILEVQPESTEETIKAQYKKLVKQYHPDISRDATSKDQFLDLQEAYQVLTDTWKRNQFNQALRDRNYRAEVEKSPESEETTDKYVSIWKSESLEEKRLRRTRYARYGSEYAGDLPPLHGRLNEKQTFNALLLIPVVVFVFCYQAYELENAKIPVTNDVSGGEVSKHSLVPAFYNPYTQQWERVLPETPITVQALAAKYHDENCDESREILKVYMPRHLCA